MKKRLQMVRLSRFGVMMAIVFSVTTVGLSKDWNSLRDMREADLEAKISEFQKRLNQNPSDYEMLKAIGIAFHIKAERDAIDFAPKAVEFLSKAHEINNKDYETKCYLGSATTMMAKTTWNPIKKMSYVDKGAGIMDEAVTRDPDNVTVRMTRGFNSLNLPSFLNRGHLALEDFEHLALLIKKDPDFTRATKKKIYGTLVELYIKAGENAKAEKYRKLIEAL